MLANPKESWEKLAVAAQYNAADLAKLCRMSTRQLERAFKRDLSRTPQDWLNERRLDVARNMLLSGGPVKKVAFDLGYKQVSHFCRQFKSYNKMTPSQFVDFCYVPASLLDNKCR